MRLYGAVSLKVCFGLGLASLVTALGCGSGGSVTLPHPSGSYTNASLKGQYVYQAHGISPSSIYRELGVFVADGAGNITSTSDDSTTNASAVLCTSACGTYQINSDGTGFITLNSTALSSSFSPVLGPLTFAVTLVSTSKVDLMEADAFVDSAGVAELQDSTATGAIPSGTFAFRLHEAYGTSLGAVNIVAEAGVVTISAGGTVSNGSMDQNLNGNASRLTLSGTLAAPASLGRGTGTFTDSSGSTTNFVYYIVNTGKLNTLVSSTNGNGAIGLGSAEVQSGAVGGGLSGTYAFGSRGDDLSTLGFFDGVATVGRFTGSGATISAGVYDSMLDGNYSASVTFTGSSTTSSNNPSAQGRVQVILSTGAVEDFWMVSPTRAFFITESSSEIEDGTADLQTTTSFSQSTMKGQFALIMDGIDLSPETVARVGALQFDGAGNLTLAELVNDSNSGSGAQSPGVLSGRYQVSSNGRIVGTLNSSTLNLVMYAVSGSDAYALQTDLGTNTSGTINLQH